MQQYDEHVQDCLNWKEFLYRMEWLKACRANTGLILMEGKRA